MFAAILYWYHLNHFILSSEPSESKAISIINRQFMEDVRVESNGIKVISAWREKKHPIRKVGIRVCIHTNIKINRIFSNGIEIEFTKNEGGGDYRYYIYEDDDANPKKYFID